MVISLFDYWESRHDNSLSFYIVNRGIRNLHFASFKGAFDMEFVLVSLFYLAWCMVFVCKSSNGYTFR